MKKYLIGIFLVAAFGFYVLFANKNSVTTVVPPNTGTTDGTPTSPEPTTTPAPTPTPPMGMGGNPMGGPMMGAYKDGTYTGPVTDAFYGKIQVVAVVKGGKITSISVPLYPDSRGHTMEVSNESLPILKQEAIAAQSGNVDVVSGATQTSEGFQQSLTAALAEAKN